MKATHREQRLLGSSDWLEVVGCVLLDHEHTLMSPSSFLQGCTVTGALKIEVKPQCFCGEKDCVVQTQR